MLFSRPIPRRLLFMKSMVLGAVKQPLHILNMEMQKICSGWKKKAFFYRKAIALTARKDVTK